ncbi:MAG: glycine cleavage system protein GcvH [Magnetococcales bacterium]|nr:glycine cleavage system protein GcvH [Magnetococcales bacterium]
MSSVPAGLHYTKEHEWLALEGDQAVVGITDFAAGQLGDVVFVELPAVGTRLEMGKPFGVVESVKSVSDLFAPVSGVVTAVNEALRDAPEKVNEDAYGAGWMIRLQLEEGADRSFLMDAEDYGKLIAH